MFSFLLNQTRALEERQRDTLLSDRLEIEGLGIYFAKEPHRPQVTNSPVYIEVINFCESQPCSPSREQRYYGLIELEPRTSVRKLLPKFDFPNVNFFSPNCSKFAVQCDWNSMISQNVQNLAFFGKLYGVFRQKTLNFFKISKGGKYAVECCRMRIN